MYPFTTLWCVFFLPAFLQNKAWCCIYYSMEKCIFSIVPIVCSCYKDLNLCVKNSFFSGCTKCKGLSTGPAWNMTSTAVFLCSLETSYHKSRVHPSRKRQSGLYGQELFLWDYWVFQLELRIHPSAAKACFFHFNFCYRKQPIHLKAFFFSWLDFLKEDLCLVHTVVPFNGWEHGYHTVPH